MQEDKDKEIANKIIKIGTDYMLKIGNSLIKIVQEYDIEKIIKPMQKLALKIEEAEKNPNSKINYMLYADNLSKYYWSMPYKIDTAELKAIFEDVNSEKDFDIYMEQYFNNEKLNDLFKDIENNIEKKHKIIFSQIKQSFYIEHYALINNAIISIIDDELSYYTYDKGETKRKDIFYPIIEDYGSQPIDECNWLVFFYLDMLNNNINVLFDNINFNNINIINSKDIRRHTTQHGKKYSNQKIVSIMLLNTLYNLLYIKKDFKIYKNKLIVKRKNGKKQYVIINKEE